MIGDAGDVIASLAGWIEDARKRAVDLVLDTLCDMLSIPRFDGMAPWT